MEIRTPKRLGVVGRSVLGSVPYYSYGHCRILCSAYPLQHGLTSPFSRPIARRVTVLPLGTAQSRYQALEAFELWKLLMVKSILATRRALNLLCMLCMLVAVMLAPARPGLGTQQRKLSACQPSPLFPTGTLMATQTGTITTPTFSADYTKWVCSDPANTWCSVCLDFVY